MPKIINERVICLRSNQHAQLSLTRNW